MRGEIRTASDLLVPDLKGGYLKHSKKARASAKKPAQRYRIPKGNPGGGQLISEKDFVENYGTARQKKNFRLREARAKTKANRQKNFGLDGAPDWGTGLGNLRDGRKYGFHLTVEISGGNLSKAAKYIGSDPNLESRTDALGITVLMPYLGSMTPAQFDKEAGSSKGLIETTLKRIRAQAGPDAVVTIAGAFAKPLKGRK